jgi:hypothetical protein
VGVSFYLDLGDQHIMCSSRKRAILLCLIRFLVRSFHVALSQATQALLDTAIASHDDAVTAGSDEKDKAAAALVAQQADDQAKAVALAKSQQANTDLMAAITAIKSELALPS